MKLLTIVWTMVVVSTWCSSDGACIRRSRLIRNAEWYDPEIQDVKLLDKNNLDPYDKRNSLGPIQEETLKNQQTVSIVSSLDVLRQKLINEVTRRQDLNDNQKWLLQNNRTLKNFGKRSLLQFFANSSTKVIY